MTSSNIFKLCSKCAYEAGDASGSRIQTAQEVERAIIVDDRGGYSGSNPPVGAAITLGPLQNLFTSPLFWRLNRAKHSA